jgi:CBS domain-containing protein
LTVGDVMVRRPKVLQLDATVAEARVLFEKPSVRTIIIAEGEAFAGTVERSDVPEDARGDDPLRPLVRPGGPSVTPETLMTEAQAVLATVAIGRLVVLDADGITLRGMLCLKADGVRFCSDH